MLSFVMCLPCLIMKLPVLPMLLWYCDVTKSLRGVAAA